MLIRGKEELSLYISQNNIRYFRASEFRCRHCGEIVIESRVIEILERLRIYFGKPIVITSAYRCRVHNKRVGGVPNSAHTRGYAVDIKCTNSSDRQRILEFLLGERVKRIGIHPRFIHFDLDPEKPSPRVWLYTKRRHVA